MSDLAPPHRPAPAASGTLKKTPLVHLLVYALERKLTGTIELTPPAGAERPGSDAILFIEGQPTKVRTREQLGYLGRVLLERGYVTEEALDKSLVTLAKTKRLHGALLREAGVINDVQLRDALRVQLVRKLLHLASLPPQTAFVYYDAFDALHDFGGDDGAPIDPFPVVWAAVRAVPPWEHVNVALTRVGGFPLRLSTKAELQRFELDEKERDLADLVRARPMRVQEMIAAEVMRPREAQLFAYGLLITKQLQVVQESASAPPPLDAPPSNPMMRSPVSPPTNNVEIATPHPAQANPLSFSLKAAVTTAPSFRAPPPLVPPDLSRNTPTPAPPARRSSSPPPSSRPLTAEAIAALAPDLAARREEIIDRAKMIDREDYFLMLDLDRDAPPEEVQKKFFALAKTWHPDRVPTAIADARPACARVFSRMSEAHQTLVDPEKRKRYMNLMVEGGATPEAQATIAAVVEAATSFQKAEICLRRNDHAQAEALARKAVEKDPQQPDYIALLAWLEALKPQNQGMQPTMEAVSTLGKAIALSNKCVRAYFYRGLLHIRLGNDSLAARDFRKAADLNPRNIDAAREVRLHEMRRGSSPAKKGSNPPPAKGKPTEKAGGSIFGKLFKK
jgi:tetratricopeptide (TPR) repeat protein